MSTKHEISKEARLAEMFTKLENTKAKLARELQEENSTFRSNTVSTIFSGLFDEALDKAWNGSFKENLEQEYDNTDDETLNLCVEKFVAAWEFAFKELWRKLKDLSEKSDQSVVELQKTTNMAVKMESILGRPLSEKEKTIADDAEKKLIESMARILDTVMKDTLIYTAASRTLLLYLGTTLEFKFDMQDKTRSTPPTTQSEQVQNAAAVGLWGRIKKLF